MALSRVTLACVAWTTRDPIAEERAQEGRGGDAQSELVDLKGLRETTEWRGAVEKRGI